MSFYGKEYKEIKKKTEELRAKRHMSLTVTAEDFQSILIKTRKEVEKNGRKEHK